MPAPRDRPADRWVAFSQASGPVDSDRTTDSTVVDLLAKQGKRISVVTDDENEFWFINRDTHTGTVVLVGWFWK